MDAQVLEVAGEQREMGHRVTVLEHASYAPDVWTVVEDWERGVEQDKEVEGSWRLGRKRRRAKRWTLWRRGEKGKENGG
jgi:hypothetical protein